MQYSLGVGDFTFLFAISRENVWDGWGLSKSFSLCFVFLSGTRDAPRCFP
jgi:hypothetical protein